MYRALVTPLNLRWDEYTTLNEKKYPIDLSKNNAVKYNRR
jgi:hypothetical protein